MFVFSPSNMSTYRSCPLKFSGQYVVKDIQWKPTPQKERGTRVHEAFERAIGTRSHPSLPDVGMEFVRRRLDDLYSLDADLWTEHDMCIRKDGTQCGFWDEDVWLRSRADLVARPHDPSRPFFLVDFKTGKKWDPTCFQLRVEAMLAHAIYGAEVVRYSYWYVDSQDTLDGEIDFGRDGRKKTVDILSTIMDMERSLANNHFPAKRGRFCKWCDYHKDHRCRH